MRKKVGGRGDRAAFVRTANRTRRENLSHKIVPRGGTRH